MVKQRRFIKKTVWHKYEVEVVDIFFLLLYLSAGIIGGILTKNVIFPICFFVGYCLYLLVTHNILDKEEYYEEV